MFREPCFYCRKLGSFVNPWGVDHHQHKLLWSIISSWQHNTTICSCLHMPVHFPVLNTITMNIELILPGIFPLQHGYLLLTLCLSVLIIRIFGSDGMFWYQVWIVLSRDSSLPCVHQQVERQIISPWLDGDLILFVAIFRVMGQYYVDGISS